jgi:DNA-binding transcriptional regulator YhcF (GntR family)
MSSVVFSGVTSVLRMARLVRRAYRELEAGKLVTSRVRTGTVVAERVPQEADDRTAADTRRLLTEAVRSFAATTRRLGIADHEALAAVMAELRGDAT